jgi:hypothetical protein
MDIKMLGEAAKMFRRLVGQPITRVMQFPFIFQQQRSSSSWCGVPYQFVAPLPPVLLAPGKHLAESPVVGSRHHEFSRLSFKTMHDPLLKELSYKIYDIQYRWIVPANLRDKANRAAREIFLDYIKKYQKTGIGEQNIVRWVLSSDKTSGRNYCAVETTSTVQYLDVSVEADDGKNHQEKGYFFPPHIVAYHEVMHAEEHKKNFYLYRYGREMITTIKTIILLDEVNKKIKHIDLDVEIDYKREVRLSQSKIPLGCFANFYRAMEKKHGNLGDAIVSDESIRFISSPRGLGKKS